MKGQVNVQQNPQFPAPTPARQGPPASATPIDDLRRAQPACVSADGHYLTVPLTLAAAMELPWQQQVAGAVEYLMWMNRHAPWPTYRVQPGRQVRLTDCSEEQLAEIGVLVEYEDDELVYRDRRTLQRIPNPVEQLVFVSTRDVLTQHQPPR